MRHSRGKSAIKEIARVQRLGAKCFNLKVNKRTLTLYSHDDAGTFTNRRIALNALLARQHPHLTQLDDVRVDCRDVAALVNSEAERLDEVLLLDPETDLALSGQKSDFAEWSIDAFGDSDSDLPLEDDCNIALLIEDVIGTGVADDMMLQTTEAL